MDAKSISALEYDKVRRRLADFTAFSGGRTLALELAPATTLADVQVRLERTAEARLYLEKKGRPPLGGAHDMRSEVVAAGRGKTLLPAELVDIRDTLRAAARTRKGLLREQGPAAWPRLAELAEGMDDSSALSDMLDQALDDDGGVLDTASRQLTKLRRDARIAHDRILGSMQKLMASPAVRDVLQEALVTQRSGRYVLPVKAQFRSRLSGVVHDTSDSGATIFVEPLTVVDQGNRYRELQIEEEKEVTRILKELSEMVGEAADSLIETIGALAQLDLAWAAADYAAVIGAHRPEIDPLVPAFAELPRARHPLLDPDTVVPIDLQLGTEFRCLVITGPNTGGKTVALKTLGLLVLMAQSGLFLPTGPGARIGVFDGVYADIGDEQSLEQSLSTFSGHMTNIIRILARATGESLVLLDELGAGTDPAEGAALAAALLDELRGRGVATAASTHYSELKGYAHGTPGVVNASVEFDVATLRPTYELTIGLPGRSNALAIAERLGLPAAILGSARQGVAQADTVMEDLLAEIRAARREADTERRAAGKARKEAEDWAARLDQALREFETDRADLIRSARETAARELEAAKDAARSLVRQAEAAALAGDSVGVRELVAAAADALTGVTALISRGPAPAGVAPSLDQLDAGTAVRLERLGQRGEVLAVRPDGMVEVALGRLRMTVAADELRLDGTPEPLSSATVLSGGRASKAAAPRVEAPSIELDLRGLRVDEGLSRLERALDRGLAAGMPFLRVIHGHGTGAMKTAVRDAVRSHPAVAGARAGERGEGGDGATVVTLRS